MENVGPRELAKMKMTSELFNQKRSGQHDMGAIVNIASQFTDQTYNIIVSHG